MYLSRKWVDLVDFDVHSQRRPKILNICVLEKLVDLDWLQNLNMCMLQNVVDLVGLALIFIVRKGLTFLIYVCRKSWLTRLT